MKKLLFAFLAMALFACSSEDSAPVNKPLDDVFHGNLVLETQNDVNSFNDAGYRKVEGDLIIGREGYSNINDVSWLASIKEVTGSLIIKSTSLKTLNGLQNLESVTGRLNIYNNYLLTDISQLSSVVLNSREGEESSLEIRFNSVLASIQGLEKVTAVSSVIINKNDKLENLTGLDGLTTVNTLEITLNNELTSFNGLGSLEDAEEITISNNAKLLSIEGMNKVSISKKFYCFNNASLVNLKGLEHTTSMVEMEITANAALTSLQGLDNLSAISSLKISSISLISLSHLSGLTTFFASDSILYSPICQIGNMKEVVSLEGLQNITSFPDGSMQFYNCKKLKNYCAIQNLAAHQPGFYFSAGSNAYNPTLQNIIDGNCSQP